MDYENLKNKKIKEVSKLIEKGQVCPEELTQFYLDKISSDSSSEYIFTKVFKKTALDSALASKKEPKLD